MRVNSSLILEWLFPILNRLLVTLCLTYHEFCFPVPIGHFNCSDTNMWIKPPCEWLLILSTNSQCSDQSYILLVLYKVTFEIRMVQTLSHHYLVILLVHKQLLPVVGQVPVLINLLYTASTFTLLAGLLKRVRSYSISCAEFCTELNWLGCLTSRLTPLLTSTKLSLLISTWYSSNFELVCDSLS